MERRIDRGDVFWLGPDPSRGPEASYSHPHVVFVWPSVETYPKG
ncbi:MAG TPA: hypothetical protein VJN18_28065 [Polyangiaceae bacterium]|nr:hypothetical protein [Polyangiaceae bacterium]